MTNRPQTSVIMSPVGLEQPELFALQIGKNSAFDLVYTLASRNGN